jgi:nucleoside-diphosphate-sugar epimerase
MRIFVTGATGWLGSSVVPELIGAGHQVVGLARSDTSAAALAATRAQVLRGSLDDLDVLGAGATDADGVIHLAFTHDFAQFAASAQAETRAIETMGAALAGSGKALVIASGTPVVPGKAATESDRSAPVGPAAARAVSAQAAIDMAARGVRSSVVRLPRTVHGEGDHGFIAQLVDLARATGVSGYVGDGSNRWPAVHTLDAAVLYRLALENAPAGTRLHAVADEGVPFADIAAAIGRKLDIPVRSVDAASAGEYFSFLERFVQVDNPASSALTRDLLSWTPTHPGLLADLAEDHYFTN